MNDLAHQLISEEEGRVPHAYQDSLGFWTIGVGHLIDARKGGRISDRAIDVILDDDITEKCAQAAQLPGFSLLNGVQQAVMVSMVFQLGYEGVRAFHHMMGFLAQGRVKEAAKAGLESDWAKHDSPARAAREMKMLASGVWVPKEET